MNANFNSNCVICSDELGDIESNQKVAIDGKEPLCWRCFNEAVQRQGWIVLATLTKSCMGVENPK